MSNSMTDKAIPARTPLDRLLLLVARAPAAAAQKITINACQPREPRMTIRLCEGRYVKKPRASVVMIVKTERKMT